ASSIWGHSIPTGGQTMLSTAMQSTRRRALLSTGLPLAGAALLGACGQQGGQQTDTPDATPKEVLWGTYTPPSDARAAMLRDMWQMAEKATGVKITVVEETSGTAWDKRQTELAAGTTSVDITYNQLNWV